MMNTGEIAVRRVAMRRARRDVDNAVRHLEAVATEAAQLGEQQVEGQARVALGRCADVLKIIGSRMIDLGGEG